MGVSSSPGGKVNASGDQVVSLTNPSAFAAGIMAGITGYGFQRVAVDPTTVFSDPFDGTFDPQRWTLAGTVVPTVTGGRAVVEAAAASGSSSLVSVPTFSPTGATFQGLGLLNRFEANGGSIGYLNSHRFFGLGTIPATTWTTAYTASTTSGPMLNAYGFEVDIDGNLYAVIYDNGTRYRADAIGQATGEKRLNLGRTVFDGNLHQFTLVFRPDAVFWYVDGQDLPAAVLNYRTASFPVPDQQTLPVRMHTINSTTAPSGTMAHRPSAIAFADTGRNATQISDGTYPWRRAAVGKNAGLKVAGAGQTVVSTNFAAAGTGTAGPVDVSEMGNVSFVIKNTVAGTAFTGAPVVVFEQSDDGTSWGPLAVVRSDTNAVAAIHTLPANTANGSYVLEASLEAINWVRARVTTGTTANGMTITVGAGGMPFMQSMTTVDRKDAGRIIFSATFTGAAITTEAITTLTPTRDGVAAAAISSLPVTAGRRLRLTQMAVSCRTTAAATAWTRFSLRMNPAGAATATSAVLATIEAGAPAAAIGATGYAVIPLDIELTGAMQFAVSRIGAATTENDTITITGYEYAF